MDESLFQVHKLNDTGIQNANSIAAAFNNLVAALKNYCPDGGREWALVKTKLEEASFYAKKSMAASKENQL